MRSRFDLWNDWIDRIIAESSEREWSLIQLKLGLPPYRGGKYNTWKLSQFCVWLMWCDWTEITRTNRTLNTLTVLLNRALEFDLNVLGERLFFCFGFVDVALVLVLASFDLVALCAWGELWQDGDRRRDLKSWRDSEIVGDRNSDEVIRLLQQQQQHGLQYYHHLTYQSSSSSLSP